MWLAMGALVENHGVEFVRTVVVPYIYLPLSCAVAMYARQSLQEIAVLLFEPDPEEEDHSGND
jgi:hypothetical protein